jgi:DNA primase
VPPSNERKLSLEKQLLRYEASREKLLPFLTGRGLGAAAIDRFRLGYVEPSEEDRRAIWHRLAIPYLTPSGVVQLRFRCLDPHHTKGQDAGRCPKFLGEAGEQVTLYNAQAVLDSPAVLFMCEGEPDVWAVETLTGHSAVGIPGARSWVKHPYWARVFTGFDRIILPADGDDAGHELAEAVTKSLPEVHVVRLPDGDDAGSVLARDVEEFLSRCGLDHG